MIVFDKNKKELNIPKGLGNVAVDITSGSTDTIMLREVERMINEAVGRTVRESKEYTDLRFYQITPEFLASAATYTDTKIAENNPVILAQANSYADSAATKVDYNYVLRAGANYDDANKFLQWVSQFEEKDYPKIRVFHALGVFQWQNGGPNGMILQAVDTSYMNDRVLYLRILHINPNQAPNLIERQYTL